MDLFAGKSDLELIKDVLRKIHPDKLPVDVRGVMSGPSTCIIGIMLELKKRDNTRAAVEKQLEVVREKLAGYELNWGVETQMNRQKVNGLEQEKWQKDQMIKKLQVAQGQWQRFGQAQQGALSQYHLDRAQWQQSYAQISGQCRTLNDEKNDLEKKVKDLSDELKVEKEDMCAAVDGFQILMASKEDIVKEISVKLQSEQRKNEDLENQMFEKLQDIRAGVSTELQGERGKNEDLENQNFEKSQRIHALEDENSEKSQHIHALLNQNFANTQQIHALEEELESATRQLHEIPMVVSDAEVCAEEITEGEAPRRNWIPAGERPDSARAREDWTTLATKRSLTSTEEVRGPANEEHGCGAYTSNTYVGSKRARLVRSY